jgi:hypothetical protein
VIKRKAVKHLIVSLNKDRMLAAARSGREILNIGELVERVPSATVVSGDPFMAVQVEVNKEFEMQLRRHVGDLCTVDYYRDFEPL